MQIIRQSEIIKNVPWWKNKCDECQKDYNITIQVGEEPFYDSATVRLCIDCLSKAFNLMQKVHFEEIAAKKLVSKIDQSL